MAKAKGTTMIGAVRFLRHHRERARDVLPPELRFYLDERVRESSWYPEEHLLGLVRALLELIPGPRPEVLASLGAHTAREHLEGVYAHLRGGEGSPTSLSRRAFALWASQHDSGRFELSADAPTELEMRVRAFALPSEEMCGIFGGYFAETLRMQGLADVEVTKTACVLHGAPHCAWRVTAAAR